MCVRTQVVRYTVVDIHSHTQVLTASVEPTMGMALKLVLFKSTSYTYTHPYVHTFIQLTALGPPTAGHRKVVQDPYFCPHI